MVDLVGMQNSKALSMWRQSTRPVAKLDHEADPPDGNGRHADSDAKRGCRRDRTGDNPDDASADNAERNEIGKDRVAKLKQIDHRLAVSTLALMTSNVC